MPSIVVHRSGSSRRQDPYGDQIDEERKTIENQKQQPPLRKVVTNEQDGNDFKKGLEIGDANESAATKVSKMKIERKNYSKSF